jgi:hypothetical protein
MLSERKIGIRAMVCTHSETNGKHNIEEQLVFLIEQLQDPNNRTHKTTLQQCKMFDTWLNKMRTI